MEISDSTWSISTKIKRNIVLENELKKIIIMIFPYKTIIKNIKNNYSLYSAIDCNINLSHEENPDTYISAETVKSIVALDSTININLFSN